MVELYRKFGGGFAVAGANEEVKGKDKSGTEVVPGKTPDSWAGNPLLR